MTAAAAQVANGNGRDNAFLHDGYLGHKPDAGLALHALRTVNPRVLCAHFLPFGAGVA